MARAMTYSRLRAELGPALDEVCGNGNLVYVPRQNGVDGVILSREEYKPLEETAR